MTKEADDSPVLSVKDRLKAFQADSNGPPKLPARKPSYTDIPRRTPSSASLSSLKRVPSPASLDISPAVPSRTSSPARIPSPSPSASSSQSPPVKPFPKPYPSPKPRTSPQFNVEPPSPQLSYQPRINPPKRTDRPAPLLPPRKSQSLQSTPTSSPIKPAPNLPPRPPSTSAPNTSISARAPRPKPLSPTPRTTYPPTFSPTSAKHAHSASMQSISLSSDGGDGIALDGLGIRSRSSSNTSMNGLGIAAGVKGKKKRPVDPRAKKRYETLWDRQIAAMDGREAIPAAVVVRIWNRSGLPRDKLRDIWYVYSSESRH